MSKMIIRGYLLRFNYIYYMGRGQATKDSFTTVIGIKRGSQAAQKARDENLLQHHFDLLHPKRIMVPGSLNIQGFYDLQDVYDYAIVEGHESYKPLVADIKEWMMTDETTITDKVISHNLAVISDLLRYESVEFLEGPALPARQAVTEAITEGLVDETTLEALLINMFHPDYARISVGDFQDIAVALEKRVTEDRYDSGGLSLQMLVILQVSDVERLQQKCLPFVDAISKRLVSHYSGYPEYIQADTLITKASDDKLPFFSSIALGVKEFAAHLKPGYYADIVE
jgi:hypothetical protein